MGIDRSQINQVLFAGLAKEGASTVLPGSPLFRDELGSAYAAISIPRSANALLDEMGLKRGAERHAPDARRQADGPDRRKHRRKLDGSRRAGTGDRQLGRNWASSF